MNRRLYLWLAILFVLAAGLRVGWVTVRYAGSRSAVLQYPDEEAYWRAARSLAAGDGLVDEFGYRATYMPAYPAFLALFTGLPSPLAWARIVQALLAAWVAPATFLLARQWVLQVPVQRHHGHRVAVLAGLAAAVDPFLVCFAGLLLTEALFAAALVTAWALVLPLSDPDTRAGLGRAATAGGVLWVCVMLRPSAAVLVIATVIAIVLGRRLHGRGVASAALLAAVVAVGLLPWAARNRAVVGQWRWLTTRGGISLYDGLQPGATGASDLAHTKTMPEVQHLSELAWDDHFGALAIQAAREDPARVLRLAGRKFRRTWALTPNVPEYRRGPAALVSAGWMLALLITAVVGLWLGRRAVRAWVMLLLPVAVVTLLHMVFVGSVRYRVPVMPMIMVISAAGLVWLVGRNRPAAPPDAADSPAAPSDAGKHE